MTFLFDALAAYRLTRLATADVILDRPRAAIIRTAYSWRDGGIYPSEVGAHPAYWQAKAEGDDEAPKLAELVVCRWCAGIYVSVGVTFARWRFPRAWDMASRALALSAAAALLARLEAD